MLNPFLPSVILAASLGAMTASFAATLPAAEDSSSVHGKLTAAANSATTLVVNANRTGLVYFDLSELPQGASIRYARFRAYLPKVSRPGAGLSLHRITSPWDEAVPSAAPEIDPTALATIQPSALKSKRYISVDITETVTGWLQSPETNEGLAIKAIPAAASLLTANVALASKEGSGSGYPAELEVELNSPNNPQPAAAPLPLIFPAVAGPAVSRPIGTPVNAALPARAVTQPPIVPGMNSADGAIAAFAFGALGDGVMDDSPALQSAIDAAIAQHRPLYIPPGQYLLKAPLKFSGRGITVFGAGCVQIGNAATVLRPAADVAAIEIETESENIVLRDFSIVGAGAGVSTKPGIHFIIGFGDNTDCALVSNVSVVKMDIGIRADDVANSTFLSCDLSSNRLGFQSAGNCNANALINCPTQGNPGGGFRLLGGGGWSIIGGDHGAGCLNKVVEINGAQGVTFQGCNFEVGPAAKVMWSLEAGKLTLINNWVQVFGGPGCYGVIQSGATELTLVQQILPTFEGVSVKQLVQFPVAAAIGCTVIAQAYDHNGNVLPKYLMQPWRTASYGDGVQPSAERVGMIDFVNHTATQSGWRIGVRDAAGSYFFADPIGTWFGADKIGPTAHLNVAETYLADKTFSSASKLVLGASTGSSGGSAYWRAANASAARNWQMRNDDTVHGDFVLKRGVGSNTTAPTLPVLTLGGTQSDSTTSGIWGGTWFASALQSGGSVRAAADGYLQWAGRAALGSSEDGVVNLTNNLTTGYGTLRLATVRLDGQGSAPASPVAGQIYFSASDKHFYGYDGSAWKRLDN